MNCAWALISFFVLSKAQAPQYANAVLVTRDAKLAQGFEPLKTKDDVSRFFSLHKELDRTITKDGFYVFIDKRLVATKTGWAVDRLQHLIQSRGLPCVLKVSDLSPDDREACLTLLRSSPMNTTKLVANPDLKLAFSVSFQAVLRKGDKTIPSVGDLDQDAIDSKEAMTPDLSESHPRMPARSTFADVEDDWASVLFFFQRTAGRATRARLASAASRRLADMISEDEQRRRDQELNFFRSAAGLKDWNGQSVLDAESLSPAMQKSLKQSANVRSLAGYQVTDCRPSIVAWVIQMADGYPAWYGFGLGSIRG